MSYHGARKMAGRQSKSKAIAKTKMKKVMGEFKRGELRSGSGAKVKSRRQAQAIGLVEARRAGARIPKA